MFPIKSWSRRNANKRTQKALSFVQQVIKEIYTSLSGQDLGELNLSTVNGIADVLNRIDDTFVVDGLYIWLRSTLTMATKNSLFGSHNPMKGLTDQIGLYWYVDSKISCLPITKIVSGTLKTI